MKTGLSLNVVCPKGRLPGLREDQAIEERPDAYYWTISTVWHACFSACPQIEVLFKESKQHLGLGNYQM
jgi:hypothetical protein